MTQKQLAETIGTSERTLRRMSPRKRQQWASLAAKGRSIAWFDVLAQLMFEVDSYNATTSDCGIAINLCKSVVTLHKFDGWFQIEQSFYVHDINQLTEALQYVQGLNK